MYMIEIPCMYINYVCVLCVCVCLFKMIYGISTYTQLTELVHACSLPFLCVLLFMTALLVNSYKC